MARAASMTGAIAPLLENFDPWLVPLYWLFLSALLCNCLYPSWLLRSQSALVQRDAAAACDGVLG